LRPDFAHFFFNVFLRQKIFPPAIFNILKEPLETNDTSTERSDTQVFGAGKVKGMALSEGLNAYLPPKEIERKVNLMEQSQDEKNNTTILFLYCEQSAKCF
jgi:hypothetical protein